MKLTRIDRFLERLAAAQHRRAGTFVLVGLLLAAAALPLVGRLGLNSRWEALLPENKPSVRDLEKVRNRVGGLSNLTVAIESPSKDVHGMEALARALVPRLRKLPTVRSVDWNVSAMRDFVWKHRFLYAKLDDLRAAEDALQQRIDYEKAHANPLIVDLLDEKPPDPRAVVQRLQHQAKQGEAKMEKYPDGFYMNPERNLLALFVRSDLGGGDFGGSAALIRHVEAQVKALDPHRYGKDLSVAYAGDMVVAREEQNAIAHELITATAVTVVLVLLSIFLFFRRGRAIVLLGAAVMPPVLITFGLSQPIVHYLNTSTAFLGSIVLGNGINPNIIWLARYFEERREQRPVGEAIAATHRGTWLATLTASLAAGLAYASLTVTNFRGFRDFGIIGGMGMGLCWVGALLLLPAITALYERFRPMVDRSGASPERGKYGVVFAKIAHAAPKPIVALSMALGIASVGIVAYAIAHDPMEYDFRNLRSVREQSTEALDVNHRINAFMGKNAEANGIAMLAPTRAGAKYLEKELESRPAGKKPWGAIHSIDDLIPKEQAQKIPLLGKIRKLMHEVEPYLHGKDLKELKDNTPPAHPEKITIDDLPPQIARPYVEKNGVRGRILLVEDSPKYSTWDGKYLVKWATALREARLPDGSRPPLAGRAPVFADMVQVVYTDGPKAILVALLATLLLVSVTFRSNRDRMLTMASLLLGILWMAATMAVLGMKLNFLNFVAFPITFGNGVDYAVNVMRRYTLEKDAGNPDAVRRSVDQTGGAVILCSLTTVIGYISLYTSANKAINSFGTAMAISETTCLLAAVLTLPALLLLLERRKSAPATTAAETSAS